MKKVVKLLGTASWVPETRISSRDLMTVLNTGKELDWVEKKLGIQERALAVTLPNLAPIKEDIASCAAVSEKICRKLLNETGTRQEEIKHLIVVTCTPDEIHFKFTTTELHRLLGLPSTTRIHEIPSGCSGLVEAMDTANAYLEGIYPLGSKVLVVAVNLTSPFFGDWQRYVSQKEWISAVIFADGACAFLFGSEEGEENQGILTSFFEVDGSRPLMHYPAGGVLDPTTTANVNRHLYSMDAKQVAAHYPLAMARNLARLAEIRPDFDFRQCKRIYLHQASPKAVMGFRDATQLSHEQVPLAGDHLGNPAAAITGIMLDQDRQAGVVGGGDLVIFSVVGAGAINGAVLLRL